MAAVNSVSTLREEAKRLVKQAVSLASQDEYNKAYQAFRMAVNRCEELYHLTSIPEDEDILVNCYKEMSKYYQRIYYQTRNRTDINPAIQILEKIIILCKDVLQHSERGDNVTNSIRNISDAYIMYIWLALDLRDGELFKKHRKNAYKYAKKLYSTEKSYENEGTLVLYFVLTGDYYRLNKKYKITYLYYLYSMKKLEKIYIELPKEEIKTDLISIYTKLFEIATICGLKKEKPKWEKKIKELGGNK